MNNKQTAKLLKISKKLHRILAASLFVVFLIISMTGLLLGWKKNSNELIMPKSYKGTSTDLSEWLSYDSLKTVAFKALSDSAGPGVSYNLDRIDARPSKGMVKFLFTDHYWEVQVDAATADILHVAKRKSDFIENIHDGSILDHIFRTREGYFKLVYTSVAGLSLLIFTLTGFWLWYGPKKIKRNKKKLRKS